MTFASPALDLLPVGRILIYTAIFRNGAKASGRSTTKPEEGEY
jgi:hypothetical protein